MQTEFYSAYLVIVTMTDNCPDYMVIIWIWGDSL